MSDLTEFLRRTLAGVNGPFEEALDSLMRAVERLKEVVREVTEGKIQIVLQRNNKEENYSTYTLLCQFSTGTRGLFMYRINRTGFPILFGVPSHTFTEQGKLKNAEEIDAHFNEQLRDQSSPLISFIAFSLRK